MQHLSFACLHSVRLDLPAIFNTKVNKLHVDVTANLVVIFGSKQNLGGRVLKLLTRTPAV